MAKVERRERPIYSAICPCCACTIVELRGVWTTGREAGLWSPDGADSPRMVRPFGPLVWTCTFCGFALMGLAVPARPASWAGRWPTCLEVAEATDLERRV